MFNKLNFTHIVDYSMGFLKIDINFAGNGANSAILDGFHGNHAILKFFLAKTWICLLFLNRLSYIREILV